MHLEMAQDASGPGSATDPVCGMSVEPDEAREKGLSSRRGDTDFFFCGRGCKLDFDEDPMRYLDPGYTPSM
jgi:YHS domain-containing protein